MLPLAIPPLLSELIAPDFDTFARFLGLADGG